MSLINGSAINGEAINGPGISGEIGDITAEGALITFAQSVEVTAAADSLFEVSQSIQLTAASGQLFDIEQLVGRTASGSLVEIEQRINLKVTASGALFSIVQSIEATASGSLVEIEQRIKDATIRSHVDKWGWDCTLKIAGQEIPRNQIVGTITVTRTENAAALMDVTLLPPPGVQDVEAYHGKRVILDVETASGVHRLYTGTIDIPDIDLVNKRITLRCTDRRNELINAQLGPQLPFIGNWSPAIFETPDDVAEELRQRLETTTKTVDFDAYGNYTISDYLPKLTADFTLSGSTIYRRQPRVEIASRGRLVNRVDIEFEARYTRLRQRERNFRLEGPSFCDVMTTPGLAFMSTPGAQGNIDGFGWIVKPGSTDFEFLPDAGWYQCPANPPFYTGGRFIWSPQTVTGTTVVQRDENCEIIRDSNGNPQTTITNRVANNFQQDFCTAVDWTGAKRFAQDVTEKINISIRAPQSIAQYGEIVQTQRNGYQVEYDSGDFEREENYQIPNGFAGGENGADYYLDKSGLVADYKRALTTAIDIGVTKIIKSHRENHVTLQRFIWPEIDLRHTVLAAAPQLNAIGKVSIIQHSINVSTRQADTEIRTSLARAQGSGPASELVIPILNAPLVGEKTTDTLVMSTYNDDGGFGSNPVRTDGIVTPDIDDESRNPQTVQSNYTYNIGLRNDLLQVIFTSTP